jgi:nitrogen regulatory protein P-II 1
MVYLISPDLPTLPQALERNLLMENTLRHVAGGGESAIMMKKIECIIRPHLVENAKKVLQELGVAGMTVMEVKGFGRQKGHKEIYRGVEYQVEFVPKLKLEVVLPAEMAEGAVQALATAARTGKFGDGKIFVSDVTDAIRIRTGERGKDAL